MNEKPKNLTNLDTGDPQTDIGTWSAAVAYDCRVPDVRIFGRSWTDKGDEVPYSLWFRKKDLPQLVFPRPLVLVNGCFDLLHTGHLMLLWKARQLAGPNGTVIVTLDSDDMIRAKKGERRPIQTFQERAAQMRFLNISYIIEIESDAEFVEIFNILKPDLRIKDEKKKYEQSRVGKDTPTCYVKRLSSSTTDLVKRIIDKNN